MLRLKLVGLLTCLVLSGFTWAAEPVMPKETTSERPEYTPEGKRIYYTQRLVGAPPEIDGVVDEACWEEGIWAGNYRQFMPNDGGEPSQNTELKILYDDSNIYVAIKAYDDPEKIDRHLGRRDAFEGDIVGVCFDSYFDHRTGFEFDLTAAGGKIDLLLLNTHWDTSWDAVWYGEVGITDEGWVAEMRIPLSQLRYGDKEAHVWGLHSWRWINRNREEDQWNLMGRNNPGHLYSIGELHGIEGIRKNRRVEFLPYAVGRMSKFGESGARGEDVEMDGAFGIDGKLGLSSAFTLDFTVNPDFGQVEADPSVMNISAFETFYEEKRPFFLEGKNIFDFKFGNDLLFYSRRIGHAPSYAPSSAAWPGAEIDQPSSTSILGALKLTGKTKGGLAIGILESVTAEETAQLNFAGDSWKETVEPLSNYSVIRVQQDFDNSNTILGGMVTSSYRGIRDAHLEFLPDSAVTGGVDFRHHWKDKAYYLDFKAIFSDVKGSPTSIQLLQQSSSRYFQRPDVGHVTFDPTRTRLSGHGGILEVGKGSRGNWRFSESLSWRSPGLELNDLGYIRVSDEVSQRSSISYVVTEPVKYFREYTLTFDQDNSWDFGGEYLGSGFGASSILVLSNKWNVSMGAHREIGRFDNRLLRGGPGVKLPGFWSLNVGMMSDNSRKLIGSFQVHSHLFDDGASSSHRFGPGVTYKFTNSLLFSSFLLYETNRDIFQFVSHEEMAGGPGQVVADIDQNTMGLTFRIDYAVTPEFTIQYYGSPFVSVGEYSRFKYFQAPRADKFEDRFHVFQGAEVAYDPLERMYSFDQQMDGLADFRIPNPDFNFREFRSNLVARWEFKPGSVLYVVWTQGRSAFESVTNPSLGNNFSELFSTPSDNVLMAKFSYWFSM